jgi:hypothetical protein
VTTSPTTETAIGQSGYCWPFSQIKTISEQLPMGPEVIKPRSAAAAGCGLVPTAKARKIADIKNLPNRARIAAPKADKSREPEQNSLTASIRSWIVHELCGSAEAIRTQRTSISVRKLKKRTCLDSYHRRLRRRTCSVQALTQCLNRAKTVGGSAFSSCMGWNGAYWGSAPGDVIGTVPWGRPNRNSGFEASCLISEEHQCRPEAAIIVRDDVFVPHGWFQTKTKLHQWFAGLL